MKDALGWNQELENRRYLRSRDIEHDIYEMVMGEHEEIKFYLKKPAYDPYDAIHGYHPEEKFRRQFFYPYMNKDTVLFDVGCAQGTYTFPALALGAKVVGFEPDKRLAPHLIDNVRYNGFQNFSLYDLFICDIPASKVDADELSNVDATTLDDFVKQTGIIPTYIKIDVEGAEQLVIKGARDVLKYKPMVFVENHVLWYENIDRWIREEMEKIGYSYTDAGEIPYWYNGKKRRNVVYSFFRS